MQVGVNSSISLQISNLSIAVGKQLLLSNINLDLHAGEFISLMGENGIGKTTLLEAVLGYRKISSGEVRFWGQLWKEKLAKSDQARIFTRMAFVSSYPEFYPAGATARDMLRALEMAYPTWNPELAGVLLEGFKIRESQTLNTMSLGENTKIRLLKALAFEPELLLLDELTANLSQESKNIATSVLIDIFSKNKMAVLYVCHSANEAISLSDRILILKTTGLEEKEM